jgi:hypothetical protein
MVSAQIGKMGSISNLNNANFSLSDGQPFNIKNDGTQYVELQVRLNGMAEGEFVTTKFEVGWNPEIVKEVKQTSLTSLNLKYGY